MKPGGKGYFGCFSPTRTPTKERLLLEPWLAPELINPEVIYHAVIDGWRDYNGEFTKESDLFAFGCLAVQVKLYLSYLDVCKQIMFVLDLFRKPTYLAALSITEKG